MADGEIRVAGRWLEMAIATARQQRALLFESGGSIRARIDVPEGLTTKPRPPFRSSISSRPRRAVRLGRNGGGGGHRTHVRKSSATGIYIISRLSRASRLSAPQPAGSPISQLLKFSPLTPERGLEPVTGI